MENCFNDKLIKNLDGYVSEKDKQQEEEKAYNVVKTDKSLIEKKITKTIIEDGRQILKS